jgi:NTE family protein
LETKNVFAFKWAFTWKLIGAILSLSLFSACAHTRVAPSYPENGTPTGAPVSGEAFGPSPDLKTEQLPSYGPATVVTKSVVLVLGPGEAKAFAEAGVIRALSDAKIQISAIYGVELGGLVGALYALDGSVNHLEWELMHFKDAQLSKEESALDRFIKRRPDSSDLEEGLNKAFGDQDISKTVIPLRLVVQPQYAQARIYDKGSIRKVLRGGLGSTSPDDFEPAKIDGVISESAASTKPFPVDEAKKYAATRNAIVIAVDVLDPKTSDLFPELKNADLIVRPDLKQIGAKDFSRRTDAVFAGKSATTEKMDEIKRLVNPS